MTRVPDDFVNDAQAKQAALTAPPVASYPLAVDPTPDSPRPPLKLDVLRRQLAGITEYLRENVWEKDVGGTRSDEASDDLPVNR